MLYATSARIGGSGLDAVALESLRAVHRAGMLRRALAFEDRQKANEKEIPSSRVGDAVMAALRDIDDVAYVRFASVYWPFRDLAELQAELKHLVERRGRR